MVKPKNDPEMRYVNSSLDRLGRTDKELIRLIYLCKKQGIQFRSLKEGMFDTTSPIGEAVMQIIAILKAMEVEVLREKTLDGLNAARARGRNGGRKPGSYDTKKNQSWRLRCMRKVKYQFLKL